MQTAPAQEGLGRIGRTKEGRISGDLGRRRPVALRRREKGILGRGIKISFGEQELISLDRPSEHDHFGSSMARPEYGSFNEVQLGFNENYQAWLHIQGLYYLGETRSVEEFGIFSQMPAERLCLGCGVQSDETFGLLPPQDRGKLFDATLRLMRLMLVDEPLDVTDDEEQLRRALIPLVHNRDGHFLATLSALLLSLLEGKTDCPISGVFGAGKTRAAAAIIAGLITADPSLKIMILTKENVASQAFAEHIIGLSLPTWIERKFGRLVGFMALQNQTTSCTRLDVPTAHRHDVLSSKQVIIGCGGGFRHECASRYSPVAQWMSEVDLVNSMAILTRQQPLPVFRAIAWDFGLVTIVKLRAVSANPLRPDDSDKSCCGGLLRSAVPYRYPFPSLSIFSIDETRPTPPSKCT